MGRAFSFQLFSLETALEALSSVFATSHEELQGQHYAKSAVGIVWTVFPLR